MAVLVDENSFGRQKGTKTAYTLFKHKLMSDDMR